MRPGHLNRRPMSPLCRFAPSPNGQLHLGHAYSALRNEIVVDRLDASLLLRLEDVDAIRCTPDLAAAMIDDLDWLGIRFRAPVLRQSSRTAIYRRALDRLVARDLVFPCFCTRGAIGRVTGSRPSWPCDPDGSPLYPGACRRLDPVLRAQRIGRGEPHALRLDVQRALASTAPLSWLEHRETGHGARRPAEPARWGDAVLWRKDGFASYHIAVVVDDAAQAVTDIVRGEDLLEATSLHRLLQDLLDLPEPRYHHHRLVLDETGRKLSKSRQSTALATLRRAGASPDAVRRHIDRLMGPAAAQGSSIVSQ